MTANTDRLWIAYPGDRPPTIVSLPEGYDFSDHLWRYVPDSEQARMDAREAHLRDWSDWGMDPEKEVFMKTETAAPCGDMQPAYYTPASSEIVDSENECPAVPWGYIYFDCGCVTRSDGQVKVCKE